MQCSIAKKYYKHFKGTMFQKCTLTQVQAMDIMIAGRECIEKIFAEVLGAEDALVRNQFISGTHALTVGLFALLRPNDTLLAISGKPYDTLDEVIGITENASSLKAFGVKYKQIDLIQNEFDVEKIQEALKKEKIKLIHIQRSKGYSSRDSITIEKIENVVKEIRKIDKDVIIFVDNCYTEFVERKSPLEVGVDVIVRLTYKELRRRNCFKWSIYCRKREICFTCSRKTYISRTRQRSRTNSRCK